MYDVTSLLFAGIIGFNLGLIVSILIDMLVRLGRY